MVFYNIKSDFKNDENQAPWKKTNGSYRKKILCSLVGKYPEVFTWFQNCHLLPKKPISNFSKIEKSTCAAKIWLQGGFENFVEIT